MIGALGHRSVKMYCQLTISLATKTLWITDFRSNNFNLVQFLFLLSLWKIVNYRHKEIKNQTSKKKDDIYENRVKIWAPQPSPFVNSFSNLIMIIMQY